MGVCKFVYRGVTKFDLTSDTVDAAHLAQGYTAHNKNGEPVTGTMQGGGITTVTILPEQSVTANVQETSGYSIYLDDITEQLIDGENYIVTIDGDPYTCHATTAWGSIYAGDVDVVWGSPNSALYPFMLGSYANNRTQWGYGDNNAHTVKIERVVSFSAPELISKSITANGTYDPADDNADGYSEVIVDVSGGGGNYQVKTNITPTTSSQTITADSGYDALESVQINAMPTGTAGTPTATKGTVSNHAVSVTPSVTNSAGYVPSETKTGTAVTVSASELVSGSETKTENGTYDVTNLASLVVNVPTGGSSNFTLLGTQAVGTVSTSSTSASDTGVTITVKGVYDYDLLVCECSVNTKTAGRHAATTRLCWLTASSNISTKNGATFATATWNCKLSSNSTPTASSSTTAYGVYANGCTVSAGSTGDNGQAVITIYRRYNSTATGTINGSYTMRVYGVKIYDLIGG